MTTICRDCGKEGTLTFIAYQDRKDEPRSMNLCEYCDRTPVYLKEELEAGPDGRPNQN